MNAAEYFLPPIVYRKFNNAEAEDEETTEVRGYLEIEVSRINFITEKSNQTKFASPIYKNNCKSNNNNKQRTKTNNQIKKFNKHLPSSVRQNIISSCIGGGGRCVAVKVIWWGEQEQTCAKVKSSLSSRSTSKTKSSSSVNQHKNHKQRSSYHNHTNQQRQQQEEEEDQQKQKREKEHRTRRHQSLSNKFRYGVRSSLALFLDYLRECPSIEIVVVATAANTSDDNNQVPLGQTRLPLPALLLQKYAENYVNGCNFVYKTKIYALYHHVKSGAASRQVQQQQQLKIGEIQLRFKMLFTAAAPPPPTTNGKLTSHASLTLSAASLLQELPGKMTKTMAVGWQTGGFTQPQNQHAMIATNTNTTKNLKEKNNEEHQEREGKCNNNTNNNIVTVRPAGKSGEIMEAMKKLDANLVALLAAEGDVDVIVDGVVTTKSSKKDQFLDIKDMKSPLNHLVVEDNGGNVPKKSRIVCIDAAQQLALFKSVTHLKLQLEALTLQPEGTKRMELLQNEIRPIFTVECQLSHELIKKVARHDMFNVMQFESEKFHSLTQCTRFAQEDQRRVNLQLDNVDDNGNMTRSSLGRIHFTIWWREPGTCLNEMLGLGTLDLNELYGASLLEQCKCITITRRGLHLASLYLKVSLLTDQIKMEIENNNNNNNNIVDSDNNVANETGNIQSTNKSCTATGQAADVGGNNNDNNSSNSNDIKNAERGNNNNKKNNNSNNNNNNRELGGGGGGGGGGNGDGSDNFSVETSKVRLLRGFLYVNETRQLQNDDDDAAAATSATATDSNVPYSLVCQPFWQKQQIVVSANANKAFNLQEQFSVINDDRFLKSVDRQQLQLEIRPVDGIVRLPLHQFYIAYRDANITNHLCKSKLPVISIDAWTPITHRVSRANLGEIKCLLAIGTEEQIAHLKATRNFDATHSETTSQLKRETSNILDMLTSVFKTSTPMPTPTTVTVATSKPATATASSAASQQMAAAPLKPHHQSNKQQTFKFSLNIVGASGLPLNPGLGKGKKSVKRQAAKRFTPNDPPSTYVTFQAEDSNGNTFKSHEGIVYSTKIIEKSTEPKWQSKFRVNASIDYLTNPQKLFILKIWKKAAAETLKEGQQPSPLEDAIIGFAALNLNLKTDGIHSGGWYNIVDFNGRITGGLEVYIHPLEDLHKLLQQPTSSASSLLSTLPLPLPTPPPSTASAASTTTSVVSLPSISDHLAVDAAIGNLEQTLDLSHLNLGQAIKRKFTELEQISNRLRTRLVDVTGVPFAPQFDDSTLDNWQPFGVDVGMSMGDDNIEFDDDDFERCLKTPPPSSSPSKLPSAQISGQSKSIDNEDNNDDCGKNQKLSSNDDRPKE